MTRSGGMLAMLLPSCVAIVETRDELETSLGAVEEAAVNAAVDSRRREFVTGRACAHRALRALGMPANPIPAGARGEPLWPPGVVGSITHCDGYRACAVARATDVIAVGIDAEPHEPLPPGVVDRIASSTERHWLSRRGTRTHFDRLLFSAKESVYKVVFPFAGWSPSYEEVEIAFDADAGTFRARVRGTPSELTGRWTASDGLVGTAIAVRSRAAVEIGTSAAAESGERSGSAATGPETAGCANAPAAGAARLSFERTVPRELVHRVALGEVFVTDSAQTGDDAYAVAVQIPRSHSLWFDRRALYHDPLAAVEAGRQGTFVVAHTHLGVATGQPASVQAIDFRVTDLGCFRDDTTPLEGVFNVILQETFELGGVVTGMRFTAELVTGGRTAMTIGGRLTFIPSDDYEMLRAAQRAAKPLADDPSRRPRPIDPALVGRFDERNVVISDPTRDAAGWRASVIVDQRHPAFFDHPQDHIPGPLMVEAYRQTALVAAMREGALTSPVAAVTRCQAAFTDFGEHEGLVECVASVTGAGDADAEMRLVLEQFGKPIAEAHVELTGYPRR